MIDATKKARLEADEVIVLVPPEEYTKVEIVKTELCRDNWVVRTGDVHWAVAGSIDAAVSVAREYDTSKDGSVIIRVLGE